MGLMLSRLPILLAAAVPLLTAQNPAGSEEREALALMAAGRLSADQVTRLETGLSTNPDDFSAHSQLFLYYDAAVKRTRGAGVEDERRKRLQHILWLIEHRPESLAVDVAGSLIDQPAQDLVEPGVGQKAAQVWDETLRRRPGEPRVLHNAAKFFIVRERRRSLDLLNAALKAQPSKAEFQQTLGLVYGMALLGVDALEFNGTPKSVKPDSAEQARVRQELAACTDALVLLSAAAQVRFGREWLHTPIGPEERAYVAELLTRARSLPPPRDPALQKTIKRALEDESSR